MSETAEKNEKTSSVEKTPPSPQEIVLNESEKSQIQEKFPDVFLSSLSDSEKTAKMQPFLTFKQAFGETFFRATVQTTNIPPYTVFVKIAEELTILQQDKTKEIAIALHNIDDFLMHMTQENAKIADFLEAQKKEKVDFTTLALPSEVTANQKLFTDRQQLFTTRITQELWTTTWFAEDVLQNMSAWFVYWWNEKFTVYASTQTTADRSDLLKLYTTDPFSPAAETIIGTLDWKVFFSSLQTQATSLLTPSWSDAANTPISLDRCSSLMDPVHMSTMINGFQKDGKIILSSNDSPYVWTDKSKQAVTASLKGVVNRMKSAKEASWLKTFWETMKSTLDDIKNSGFLEIFKELCATLKEVFEAFNGIRDESSPDKGLDATTSEPRQRTAIEYIIKNSPLDIKNMAYDDTTFQKIKQSLVEKSDPTSLEKDFKATVGVDSYKKIFVWSSLVDPVNNPSALRELLIEKMGTALGKNATDLTEMKKPEKQETSYKELLGAYLDLKKAAWPESERKFNTPSSDRKAYGAERFTRAIFVSLLCGETKAKVPYEQIPSVDESDNDLYMLDHPHYTYEATSEKITFSQFWATHKYGVRIGSSSEIKEITSSSPSIDVRWQSFPVTLHLLQWSTTKNQRHEKHTLDLPCEKIWATKTWSQIDVTGLDIQHTYEASWDVTKDGTSSQSSQKVSLDAKTPTQSFVPVLGTWEVVNGIRIRRKGDANTPHPRQKIAVPASSA